ncbi:hypothetical protein LX36DRAFT_17939 [Colletotrichum falcatum]|nr:hypothetical protein LX36DRAFT_17939 [Colletotrichum falcatum]
MPRIPGYDYLGTANTAITDQTNSGRSLSTPASLSSHRLFSPGAFVQQSRINHSQRPPRPTKAKKTWPLALRIHSSRLGIRAQHVVINTNSPSSAHPPRPFASVLWPWSVPLQLMLYTMYLGRLLQWNGTRPTTARATDMLNGQLHQLVWPLIAGKLIYLGR